VKILVCGEIMVQVGESSKRKEGNEVTGGERRIE